MIPDYYPLSFPRDAGEPSPADLSEMLVLGMTRAQALDRESCSIAVARSLVNFYDLVLR